MSYSLIDAVIKVLGDNYCPMKATEISDAILAKGYYLSAGGTPERTISSYLTNYYSQYFKGVGNGMYELNKYGHEKYFEISKRDGVIDKYQLKLLVESYKRDFKKNIPNEIYKWEAVKCFQENWDIEANDFAEMLERSLSKTKNLLDTGFAFPRAMIVRFARLHPEQVQSCFIGLFAETEPIEKRINNFVNLIDVIHKKWKLESGETGENHYQTPSVISTYLWLRYPDKYYIYKPTIAKNLFKKLGLDIKLHGKGAIAVVKTYELYDEINSVILQDSELRELLNEVLTDDCYSDNNLKTMMIDFAYYAGKYKEYDEQNDEKLNAMIDDDTEVVESSTSVENEPYTNEDFLREVYMDSRRLNMLQQLIKTKKNIILQGAPGVGKTFCAKRLAYTLMGKKDDSRIEFVQFHQNYSYEDFVMGYKPVEGGSFELKKGVFYDFCQKAKDDEKNEYFFIIDEINRGNLSKIFGELLMLIEKDYRGDAVTMAYSDEKFHVPSNVHIIGMMNTADRSLAMIDYALRRRFSFVEICPGFESEGFKQYQENLNHDRFDKLIKCIVELNEKIRKDDSLGTGFEIGHSYFCNQLSIDDNWLQSVIEFDIIPMLQEYWFDDRSKADEWQDTLEKIFND